MFDEVTKEIRLKNETEPKSSSLLEGVGSGALYGNLMKAKIKGMVTVSDAKAIAMMRYILQHEGFFVGGTSGMNIFGAVELARKIGPGKTIVTIFCDSGMNYIEKHWSDKTLEDLNLPKSIGENIASVLELN